MTAFNEIGQSVAGSVIGGFPISKLIFKTLCCTVVFLHIVKIFLLQIFCLLIFNGKHFIKQMELHTWRYGSR